MNQSKEIFKIPDPSMANRKSRYEWKVNTPVMIMPDGTCRSFDTFTSDELKEWGS